MAAMDVSVQLRLMDQLTGPAQNAARSMEKLKSAIQGTGAAGSNGARGMEALARSYDNLAAKAERAAARMAAAKTKAVAGAAGLFTLGGPLAFAADFQEKNLRTQQVRQWDEGITGIYQRGIDGRLEMTAAGRTKLNELMRGQTMDMIRLSQETNQSAKDLLEGYASFTALAGDRVKDGELVDIIRAVGLAATATGADIKAGANTAFTGWRNLGIKPQDMNKYLDILHMGGKVGGFEFADTAMYFPMLGSAMGTLLQPYRDKMKKGMTDEQFKDWNSKFGLDTSARLMHYLEVAREGTHDAATTATNLDYLIQKTGLNELKLHFEKFFDYNKIKAHPDADWLGFGDLDKFVDRSGNMKTLAGKLQKSNKTFQWDRWLDAQIQQGIDPVLASLRAIKAVTDVEGTMTTITKLFNSHSELRALRPLFQAYREDLEEDQKKGLKPETTFSSRIARLRTAQGVIEQDATAASEMLSFRFKDFLNSAKNIGLLFMEGGALGPVAKFFGLMAAGLKQVTEYAAGNRSVFDTLARGAMAAVTAISALAIGRYGLAALQFGLAKAGMAGISLLRVIPGMGAVVGALGAVSGPIGLMAKLGLLGAAGFFGWQHWDKLAPYMATPLTYMQGVFSRLAEMFPSLSTYFGVMSESLKSMVPNLGSLGDIGRNLKDGFGWLLGQGGDSAGFSKAKDGLMGLFGNSGMLDRMKEMASSYKDALGGGQGPMAMIKAWGTLGLAGLGGFAAGAMAKYGPAGLISMLMALRSILFVAGLVVGALQVVASLAGIFLIPILERMLETKGGQMFLKSMGGLAALIGLGFYQLGWQGMKDMWRGFSDSFAATSAPGVNRFKSAMGDLLKFMFPEIPEDQRLETLANKAMQLGMTLGSWVDWGANMAAAGIERFTSALKYLETNWPTTFNALSTIASGWGMFLVLGGILAGPIMALGRLAMALLGVGLAVRLVSSAFALLWGAVRVIALIGGALAVFGGPITVGILAAAAAIALIATNWETVKAAMATGWDWLTELPARMTAKVTEAMTAMREGVMGMINGMHDWFAESWLGKVLGLKSSKDKTPDVKPDVPNQPGQFGNPMGDQGGFQPMNHIGPQIQAAGDSASAGIIGGGNSVAAALAMAAAAIASAAASIRGAAAAAPGIQARLGGALSDAPVRT